MRILHIAPHLGGGVGKAHATLAEAAVARGGALAERHDYVLLEPPRDVVYTQRLQAAGCGLHIAPDAARLAALAAAADIVQLEWWNHPRLYHALVTHGLPPARLIAWIHISGLAPPLVPRSFAEAMDQTLFTSACSFDAPTLRDAIAARPAAFHHVTSGFGFDRVRRPARPATAPPRLGYLGTLDFAKLHPHFFAVIDSLDTDIEVTLWGRADPAGPVARAAAAMRHPHRVRFAGYTDDPRHVLAELDVLVYLLAPDHYGTAENVLVEAMSAGAVPLVLANPAELRIVTEGRTGMVARDPAEAAARLAEVLRDPGALAGLRASARAEASRHHGPQRSAAALSRIYGDAMRRPKQVADFQAALGPDPRAWFLSSLVAAGYTPAVDGRLMAATDSKGSLGHFRACLPQDEGLRALQALAG